MTNQEMVDKVCDHLMRQGEKSQIFMAGCPEPICRYRGYQGLKYAAGCVIPDDEYDPKFEGTRIRALIMSTVGDVEGKIPSLKDVDSLLLSSCQHVHDNYDVEEWPEQLRRVVEDAGLIVPESIR